MKRLDLFICIITMLCLCLCGCDNNKGDNIELSVNENQDHTMPETYTSILDKAFGVIVDYDNDYACDEGEGGIVEASIGLEPMDALSKIGYSCIDFDGNGTRELVIAEKGEDSGDRILAVYTIKNDRAILLFEGLVRSRYYYLNDNTFYYEGSGGAAYTVFGTYIIEDDGITFSATDCYFSDFKDMDDLDSFGWFHNTTGEHSIATSDEVDFSSEDEPFEMMKAYEKKAKSLDLTLFSDYESEYAINLLKEKAFGGTDSGVKPESGADISNTNESEEPEETVENGILYKTLFDRYGDTAEVVAINTESNQLYIFKPEMAVETQFNEKCYAYTISNDWINVNFKYEIKDDINSAVDCEYYIDGITATLPMTLSKDYASTEEAGVYTIQGFKDIFISDAEYEYMLRTDRDVHDIWYTSVGNEGVAYFYESCTYPTRQSLTFSKMISQACNYYGGVALLETVEVTYFNYPDVFNSLGTTIEKNQMSSELNSILNAISGSYVSTPNGSTSFATCIYGFNNCLWDKVKLIQ